MSRHAMIAALLATGGLLAAGCAAMPSTDATSSTSSTPGGGETTPQPPQPSGRVAPPFASLTTNDEVVALIKSAEGLELEAYASSSGGLLIGYGHSEGVRAGQRITEAEANQLLRDDLKTIEDDLKAKVTVPMNVAELSAMVDLAYTLGTGRVLTSTVMNELNAGNREAAADGFLLWDRSNPTVHARRERERAIFLGE